METLLSPASSSLAEPKGLALSPSRSTLWFVQSHSIGRLDLDTLSLELMAGSPAWAKGCSGPQEETMGGANVSFFKPSDILLLSPTTALVSCFARNRAPHTNLYALMAPPESGLEGAGPEDLLVSPVGPVSVSDLASLALLSPDTLVASSFRRSLVPIPLPPSLPASDRPLKAWDPSTHAHFPASTRHAIVTTLLIARSPRSPPSTPSLSSLPLELLFIIFSFIAAPADPQ